MQPEEKKADQPSRGSKTGIERMKFLPSDPQLIDEKQNAKNKARSNFELADDDEEDLYSNEFEASHRGTDKPASKQDTQNKNKAQKESEEDDDYEDDFD